MKRILVLCALLLSFQLTATDLYPILSVWGAGLGADIELMETQDFGVTAYNIQGSGGYQTLNYFYTANALVRVTPDKTLNYNFNRIWGDIQTGIKQKIDRSTVYLLYRGDLVNNFSANSSTYANYNYYDEAFTYLNSLKLGIIHAGVETNYHGAKSGINFEIAYQQGIIDSAYSKITAGISYLHTFYSKEEIFSVYAGGRMKANYLFDTNTHFIAKNHFAGINRMAGLGGAIRGLEDTRFAGQLMLAGNFDLRFNISQINLLGLTIIPGLITFSDHGFAYDPDIKYGSENVIYCATVGGGIYFDAQGIIALGVYSSYSLNNELISTEKFKPISIMFGFHL